jgi:hypothetical protein
VTVYLDQQHGAFHGTNPEVGDSIRRPALDHRLSLRTTDKTKMISRADGGAIEESLPVADHAPSRQRNRSGPVAGRGLSMRPGRMARVYRDADRSISLP